VQKHDVIAGDDFSQAFFVYNRSPASVVLLAAVFFVQLQ
jgi:hypothetical protein